MSEDFNEEITGPHPTVYKSVAPALTDPNFLSLCANMSSNTILAHVRATSLSPVVQTNCHPFCFGRHAFAHNGSVALFNTVRRPLSDLIAHEYFAAMKGTTDSEHLAALYMTYLGEGAEEKAFTVQEMRDALVKTIRTLQDTQKKVLSNDQLEKEANSLNLVASKHYHLHCCPRMCSRTRNSRRRKADCRSLAKSSN
jgi:glutamine amidotransferase